MQNSLGGQVGGMLEKVWSSNCNHRVIRVTELPPWVETTDVPNGVKTPQQSASYATVWN